MKRDRTKAHDVLLFDAFAPSEVRFEDEVREYAIEWLAAYLGDSKRWSTMNTEELVDLFEEVNVYMDDDDYYVDDKGMIRSGEALDEWTEELADAWEEQERAYRENKYVYYYGCKLDWRDELAIMNGCSINDVYAQETSEAYDDAPSVYERCILWDTDPRKFWNVNLQRNIA